MWKPEQPLAALLLPHVLLGQHRVCLGELEDTDVLVRGPAASHQLRGCGSVRGTVAVSCVTTPGLGWDGLKSSAGACE